MTQPHLVVLADARPGDDAVRVDPYDCLGKCSHPYDVFLDESDKQHAGCQVFECERCERLVPWCFGGGEDDLCDDCWCATQPEGFTP